MCYSDNLGSNQALLYISLVQFHDGLAEVWSHLSQATVELYKMISLLRSSISIVREPAHTQVFLSEPHHWI